ncbi:MAG: NAD(P)/FAD-dependent oxidoreductase [Anaerolineales bacterium]
MTSQADIVICGAGITGVSAAYFLAKAGVDDILLIDERPPLTFTSDRSNECYRNWWPDPAMLALMNRSIDLMEELADESGNIFHLNRRGYLYVTADENQIPAIKERSERLSKLGAGQLRIHSPEASTYHPATPEDFHGQPDGADLLLGLPLIQKHFPYLTEKAVAALHIRRAGWLSAQQLGMYLLEQARSSGVRSESARVTAVDVEKGRVRGVRLGTGERIDSPIFINAAGPYLKKVGTMLGIDIPVHTELHLKAAIRDALAVVGRDAPLLIWNDPQSLPWTKEERAFLAEDSETAWLTESFPSGVHTRPEGTGGSQTILMLWDYQEKATEPVWPPHLDEQYPEIALRGLAAMLPGMKGYFDRIPRPQLDGGYYTKTRENRPLIGPLPLGGAFVTGAVSGYGIMSACAVGELLAHHVTGTELPEYATAFVLSRYDDPKYLKKLETWADSGQL